MSLTFEFVQLGEFHDPFYKIKHENGSSIGLIIYSLERIWLYQPHGDRYSSRILDQISSKLKQLNKEQ